MTRHCCNSKSNCVCCNKTRIKASWDNCLDNRDVSNNKLCTKPVKPREKCLQSPTTPPKRLLRLLLRLMRI